jgi:hypothetical protein
VNKFCDPKFSFKCSRKVRKHSSLDSTVDVQIRNLRHTGGARHVLHIQCYADDISNPTNLQRASDPSPIDPILQFHALCSCYSVYVKNKPLLLLPACYYSPFAKRSSSSTVIWLMRFFENSNAVKKMALTTHERDMETPRPRYMRGFKN